MLLHSSSSTCLCTVHGKATAPLTACPVYSAHTCSNGTAHGAVADRQEAAKRAAAAAKKAAEARAKAAAAAAKAKADKEKKNKMKPPAAPRQDDDDDHEDEDEHGHGHGHGARPKTSGAETCWLGVNSI